MNQARQTGMGAFNQVRQQGMGALGQAQNMGQQGFQQVCQRYITYFFKSQITVLSAIVYENSSNKATQDYVTLSLPLSVYLVIQFSDGLSGKCRVHIHV